MLLILGIIILLFTAAAITSSWYLDRKDIAGNTLITIVMGLIFVAGLTMIDEYYHPVSVKKVYNPTKFYNGEGNQIPNHIVELEVKSHFVKLKQCEKDSINKYFYLDTLR